MSEEESRLPIDDLITLPSCTFDLRRIFTKLPVKRESYSNNKILDTCVARVWIHKILVNHSKLEKLVRNYCKMILAQDMRNSPEE
ncbi:hypothetical protein RND71_025317 [Anisodus tanguticus]|uniref:Uncharacterized protein n=1 Tax=Anisodus tanguticus TaxID=243964 RepID=A0AAE1RSQ9_9SOLA|nr:hypothetical protein RND71_025317 [Anisodus tanguticus]